MKIINANIKEYQERMSLNIEKKLDFIKYINEFKNKDDLIILDFGCAEGTLTKVIAESFIKSTIYGYDIHEESIKNANKKNKINNNYFVCELNCEIKYDIIILSSICHEIISYHDNKTNALSDFFKYIKTLLKDDGKIIIREGFKFEEIDNEVTKFKLLPEKIDESKQVLNYILNHSQFKNYYNSIKIDKEYIYGNINSLIEFFNKQTWGLESLPREAQEIVNCLSLSEWENEINSSNLKIILNNVTTDDTYFQYLNKFVEIDNNEKWPTKFWLVIEKRK